MKRLRKRIAAIILVVLILLNVISLNCVNEVYAGGTPGLVAQYDFDGTLNDSLGGSSLTAYGTDNDGFNHNNATSGFGTDATAVTDKTYWYWTSTLPRGGGFWVDVNDNISTNYSIGVRFSFANTESGYRKIIDFKNSTSDNGFYFYGGGKLNFFPQPTLGSSTTLNNQIVDIIATRDSASNTFIAYVIVNGTLYKELEYSDGPGDSIPSLVAGKPRFGFFFDENGTASEATNGGRVYSVKIWNGPITETQAETAMNTFVTYSGNGNTGGTVPVDSVPHAQGDTVTILGNTGSLTKTDYTFDGWNTQSDGNGTDYDATGTDTLIMPASNVMLYAKWIDASAPDTTAPALTAGAVTRMSDTEGTVKFTSDEAGTYYYSVAADGAAEPAMDTSGAGIACTTSEVTITNPTGLTAGAKDIFIKVKDAAGNVSNALKIDIAAYTAPDNPAPVRVRHPSPNPPDSGTDIIVNDEKLTAGTSSTITSEGKKITTITVDDAKLNKILEEKGSNAIVTIPSTINSDVTIGVLNGQTVKSMEEKAAVLEIKTGSVSYTLPASEINISDVSAQLGASVQLKDIKISVSIAEPPANTIQVVQDTANENNYKIVVKPVDFEITCTSGDKTVSVSKFNGYVERTVAIPDGIDPSKITTGIVLNSDGTFSHVPTQIVIIDGKYYAKINSLTNSTYSVIYNPVEFADVSKHWAKDSINDMGSRLVVTGIGNENYGPNRDITRAEFAVIIIKALGLKAEKTESSFTDIKSSDWYAGHVEAAASYGIITGYSDGKFSPKDKITREQAMTMIARAMKLTGLHSTLTKAEIDERIAFYSDGASSSKYAKEGIASCLKTGVVSGKSSSKLAPKDYITRAEVAVIIERMLKESELI